MIVNHYPMSIWCDASVSYVSRCLEGRIGLRVAQVSSTQGVASCQVRMKKEGGERPLN